MDFIERWFGVSPDGGDGSLEVKLLIAALAILGTLCYAFLRRRARVIAPKPTPSTQNSPGSGTPNI